ncbi:MAG TPA: sodium:proton antiporter [Amnibacterium sp.]|nr:sodium:proton antiporter [Amnibacterium sp.]
MELAVYAVLAVAVIVAVAAFAPRLGVAAPIVLVLVGVGLSFLPGMPAVEVEPQLILDVALPPILYAAAISLPLADFRRNVLPIASLSVILVLITAFGAGFVLFALLPNLALAPAIALGAVISPPDAVAATSVGRRLGLPPRLLTVLEGEGLVNDATALVLLRSASAAAAGNLLTPWALGRDFVFAAVVGVAVGLAAGFVTMAVRTRLSDPVLDTAVSLAVPFVAFVPTQFFGASGVLAVVVAGLYTSHAAPAALTPQARISDRINWRTIQFLLENGVFLLIGLELRTLIEHVDPNVFGFGPTILVALAATLALVLIRLVWMVPLVLALRARAALAERTLLRQWLAFDHYRRSRRGPIATRLWHRAERAYPRRRADLEELRRDGVTAKGGLVLGWSGMRGVVTLAAAQSLPKGTNYYPQLVLIAFIVAVLTLVVQGGTLPAVIRLLGVRGTEAADDQRELAALLDELGYAGLAALDEAAADLDGVDDVDPAVLDRVRQSSFLRAEAAWERSRGPGVPLHETPNRLYRRLRLAVVQAERERLLDARRQGEYSSHALLQAQALLDLEESRLSPAR